VTARDLPADLADAAVELTRRLVAIPSVNPSLVPEGAGESEIAELCADGLQSWGFEVEWHEPEPGRPSLVARLEGSDPASGPGNRFDTLILNGHLDTVGIEGMTIDPFDPIIEDGHLLGRGSCDMKSGVAAILAAARAVALDPRGFRGRLVVALTADEEHASLGLRDLLDSEALTPGTASAAIVTEPTSLALMPANKGFIWFDVEVEGVAAHGSRPDRGRDAIRTAGRVLAALDEWEARAAAEPEHPLLGQASIHAGTIRGGTSPSVYPDGCTLTLEARTLPGSDGDLPINWLGEAIREHVLPLPPGMHLRLKRDLARPPSELALEHPLVTGLAAACRAEGFEPPIEGMSAWVESAFFNEAGIPSLCFGPGSIEQAHSAAEFVPVAEIRTAARVLERWLRSGGGAP